MHSLISIRRIRVIILGSAFLVVWTVFPAFAQVEIDKSENDPQETVKDDGGSKGSEITDEAIDIDAILQKVMEEPTETTKKHAEESRRFREKQNRLQEEQNRLQEESRRRQAELRKEQEEIRKEQEEIRKEFGNLLRDLAE
jgi:uncharacterized protein involved in exopolysaccharide biosynthesis